LGATIGDFAAGRNARAMRADIAGRNGKKRIAPAS
jgi:hypothetical protein